MTDHQLRGREGPGLGAGGRQALARLDGSGVAGLGPPWAHCGGRSPPTNPCSDPRTGRASPSGLNSPVQADAVRASGDPADLSFSFIDQIKEGACGAPSSTSPSTSTRRRDRGRQRHRQRRALAEGVRARPEPEALERPHPQQQDWVREAAQAVKASVDAPYDEATAAGTLCDRGPRFRDATPGQLQACAPGSARCSTSSPPTRPAPSCSATSRGSPQYPPRGARGAGQLRPGRRRQPVAWPGPGGDVGPPRRGVPPPAHPRPGRRRRGDPGSGPAGTWTLRVRGGTFQLSCRPVEGAGVSCGDSGIDSDVIVEAGDLRGRTVDFVGDVERVAPEWLQAAGDQPGRPLRTARDPPDDLGPGCDQLSFTDFQEHRGEISEPQPLEWTGGPWRKIA